MLRSRACPAANDDHRNSETMTEQHRQQLRNANIPVRRIQDILCSNTAVIGDHSPFINEATQCRAMEGQAVRTQSFNEEASDRIPDKIESTAVHLRAGTDGGEGQEAESDQPNSNRLIQEGRMMEYALRHSSD